MGRNLSYIPSSIPSSIETLDFSFNGLKHLKKTVFPVFYFLRVFDLSRCHIKLVLVDVGLSSLMLQMNDLTKLQELRVGTNIIQSMSLPPFMSTFKDFSLLDLHANNISIIKTDHTAVLREIGRNMTLYMVLISKDIDFLDGLCFIYFQEVHYYIMEKPIETISVFCCMINATNVALIGGLIDEMDTLPGKQLSHLHTLEKMEHKICAPIWADAFIDMPKLQYLDLSSNQIRLKQCCTSLFGTPQISYLNLSSNAEIGLDLRGLEGLDSLEILDFHHTTVVCVGYLSVLSNLKYLRYLYVSYSCTTFTNIFSFYGLKNLNVLKIAGNNFQGDVARYLFNNLTSRGLRLLNLRGNHLMTINFLAYPDLKQLTSLYVDKNSITSIPLHVLQSLPTNLSEFDLSSNPIDCSCSQTDFIWWIIQNQNVLKQPENIFCKTTDFRTTDFDIDSCVHKKRLTIVLSVCFVTVVVVLSFLVYRFQGYRSPGQQECSYDAFVIFSSYDEVWVMNELMENLENSVPPIQLCLHMRDFQAGKSIASNIIDEGIMGSRKIIVVVSQHFIDSAWCRFEFELAQSRFMMERSANIIIIILEDVEERKTKKVFGLHKHLKKNTYLKWSRDPLSNMGFWICLRKAIIATNQ
uniref:Toll-like receptor 4 n=2 Tax=Sinocyclocheilus anshuiensis TaxID=1608454 RepID=A0A671NRS2_9TELE